MKLSFYFLALVAIVLIEVTYAATTSNKANTKSQNDVVDNGLISAVTNRFGNLGKSLIDRIAASLKFGIGIGQNLARLVEEVTKSLIEAANNSGKAFIDGVRQQFQTFAATIEAFRLILQEAMKKSRNNIIRSSLKEVDSYVAKVNESVYDLQKQIFSMHKEWEANASAVDNSTYEEMKNWRNEILGNLNISAKGDQNVYAAGEKVVTDFISEQEEKLNQCADQVIYEMDYFEKRIEREMTNYNDIMKSVVGTTSKCLMSDTHFNALRCQNRVTRDITKLDPVVKSIDGLIEEAKMFVNFGGRRCVLNVKHSFGHGKDSVEIKIQNILSEAGENGIILNFAKSN